MKTLRRVGVLTSQHFPVGKIAKKKNSLKECVVDLRVFHGVLSTHQIFVTSMKLRNKNRPDDSWRFKYSLSTRIMKVLKNSIFYYLVNTGR